MKTDLNYCIVLSSEQLAYLAGSKYGIDRMKILHRLIEAAVLKGTDYAIKGFSTTLQVGQAILSEVDFSCKLGYDKKTISRVLDKMNQLGIVASTLLFRLLHSLRQGKNLMRIFQQIVKRSHIGYGSGAYVFVWGLARSSYVAQIRYAHPYYIGVFRQSQAPTVLSLFRLMSHP